MNVRDTNGQTLASNTKGVSFGGTDLYVNWHRVPELNIKVGQFKPPFGLEQITPDTKLPFTERTAVTEALTPERQIGAQIDRTSSSSSCPGARSSPSSSRAEVSITAGVNYYIRGDELKLMADYIHTWSDFRHNNGGLRRR